MNDISPELAVRPDRPIDPVTLDILRRVDSAAAAAGITFFVAGALARDIVLFHIFGCDPLRATQDVDLGIFVADWERFERLKSNLVREGNGFRATGAAQRLIYSEREDAFGIPLDLIPFGMIERDDATLAWPPGQDVLMNVAGFAEAHESALVLALGDDLRVRVVSLPSLAVLKLIAWRDRHLETNKDATDFLALARNYHEAGNLERLYDTEQPLLTAAGFDPELAGAMLLGKDAALRCIPRTANVVRNLFADSQLMQQLADQLLSFALISGDDPGARRAEQFLTAFRDGFTMKES